MLKLYGIALSNYTNMVRAALIEKDLAYEFVIERPSQDASYLASSPMGKVPCLVTDDGPISETSAILDYLEDVKAEPALLPADAYQRAKARELTQAFELYVELVARKGVGILFGNDPADHVKQGLARDLPRGMQAVGQLAKFSPYLLGEHFTYTDLVGYYSMGLANTLAEANCDLNLFELLPGSADWFARVGARPSVQATDADFAEARAKMGL